MAIFTGMMWKSKNGSQFQAPIVRLLVVLIRQLLGRIISICLVKWWLLLNMYTNSVAHLHTQTCRHTPTHTNLWNSHQNMICGEVESLDASSLGRMGYVGCIDAEFWNLMCGRLDLDENCFVIFVTQFICRGFWFRWELFCHFRMLARSVVMEWPVQVFSHFLLKT